MSGLQAGVRGLIERPGVTGWNCLRFDSNAGAQIGAEMLDGDDGLDTTEVLHLDTGVPTVALLEGQGDADVHGARGKS